MKIYYCFVLLILTSFLSSCSKEWIEAKPVLSQKTPTTLGDFRAMLDANAISFAVSPSLSEVAADNHLYTDATWNSIKNNIFGNAYTWNKNVLYNSVTDWTLPYAQIFQLNIALEGLKDIYNEENRSEVNELIGEALLHRSKFFYGLAMTFSPMYNSQINNLPLGIPLRIISDIEKPTSRSTVQETYDQILKDLKLSVDLLPEKSDYITRPTKQAAIGYLARIYLAMEMYDSAYKYSDQYLKRDNSLIDYNLLSTSVNFVGLNKEISYLNFTTISALNNYLVPVSLFDKYAANDLRKKVFFIFASGQYRFKGSYSKNQNDNFSGIATDEMYLIRSECFARMSNISSALKDLNDLLRTRFQKTNGQTTYVDYSTADQTEALKKILEEREKELILRNVRWSDLRRLNRDSRFAKTITRTIGGSTYTLEPNSHRYTFPIPDDIISKSGIGQNPGWE